MIENILEEGLKSIENVLKLKEVEENTTSKGGETDSEQDKEKDDEKNNNDGNCESSQLHVFDPPCVRLKGVSNARMKSQLEKKKRKKQIQVGHYFDHVGKTKNQNLRGANQGNLLLPS